MLLKTAFLATTVAAFIGLVSMIPADLSKLNTVDYRLHTLSDPTFPKVDLTETEKQREEALLFLFFLKGSAHGSEMASIERPADDIERREVALPSHEMGGKLELASSKKWWLWLLL
ncbi:hypothetical protein HFO91_30660 [Rhizobium leguminosarum]|uniref:hypothetical protein n=1 Tax=Rhizobium leguminosarum TaxID=384 RepID=UPI001C95271D|nr:hypothetical protein [Rhizobium leguminosarum]MBY5453943.1 hypothetical protein [Rhizobium leguminosarum]